MKPLIFILFFTGCVIQVEIPTSKTILEKQISGEIQDTDESVLMRAVTRGESMNEILASRSDAELGSLEQKWFEIAIKYLDSGYIGLRQGSGLVKVEKNFDDSEQAIEGLIVASRINLISRELATRSKESQFLDESYFNQQKGWWVEKNGVWTQSGVNR